MSHYSKVNRLVRSCSVGIPNPPRTSKIRVNDDSASIVKDYEHVYLERYCGV